MTTMATMRLAALLIPVVVAACGGGGDASAAATEGVSVTLGASDLAAATTATLRAGVALSGALEPKVIVDVGAPLAEQLRDVFVNEGERVAVGTPLVRFRDDVLRAAAASARADVARARAGVSVAVAESTRAQTLLAEGAIAPRDRDNALLAVDQARAQFALAEAQQANAEDRLDNSVVKAPVAGVVSRRLVQAGDRVDFGKPLMTIVNTSVLQLEASVEARWIASLRVGRPVRLTVTGVVHDTILGRIARINPTADPATRQVRIYVDVPNSGNLVGGLFVSGRALLEEVRDAVAVPRSAVRYEGEERTPAVYAVVQGRIMRRVVEVGVEDPDQDLVQIRSGVAPGDVLVVGPVDALADGTKVEVPGAAPAEAAPAARR
jgi:membrane fusion protein (multidrug efflux system)